MFNLDQAIAEWRRQMLAAGIKTPVPLEELESHLRDGIERQRQWGLDEAEAFKTAVETIGQAQAVQNEFKKVEEEKDAREWKWVQILMVVPPIAVSFILGGMMLLRTGIFSAMTSAEQAAGFAAVVVLSLLIGGGRAGSGMFPVIPAKRTREILGISGSVLVSLWWIVALNMIVPHYDFTMGQLLVAVLWGCFAPAGALIGLTLGMEDAARKKSRGLLPG